MFKFSINEIMKVLDLDCKRLLSYFKKYNDIQNINFGIKNIQYSTGGTVQRGFYHPSLIKDLVIQGCSRGRLIKNKDKYDIIYTYYFDECDKLIFVETFPNTKTATGEYIVYQDNISIGFEYSIFNTLNTITECIYNEDRLIKSYSYILLTDKSPMEIYKEEYLYSGDVLTSTIMYEMGVLFNSWVRIIKFNFTTDDNGYLSTYSYGHHFEQNPKDKIFEMIDDFFEFPIKKKRKISDYKNPFIFSSSNEKKERKIFINKQKEKMNFKDYLYKKIYDKITKWDDENIYAISFYVHAKTFDNIPEFYISYNTEEVCNHCDESNEKRWNYAFWLHNEEEIISDQESTDLMMQWFEENNIKDIGYENLNKAYDNCMKYIGKGPNGLYDLIQLIVEVAKEIHSCGLIKTKLGKELPIIIHDLEYPWFYLEATKNANPNGEADIFLKAKKDRLG